MRWGIAGIAGLMLAGCGGEVGTSRRAEHSIDPVTGETRMTIPHQGETATLRAGPAVPVALPAGLSLFPGTRIAGNARFAQGKRVGSLLTFAADAPAADVMAHYRREAEAAGFAIVLEHAAAGSLIFVADRGRDGARLAITAKSGPPTTGQVVLLAVAPR